VFGSACGGQNDQRKTRLNFEKKAKSKQQLASIGRQRQQRSSCQQLIGICVKDQGLVRQTPALPKSTPHELYQFNPYL